MRHHAPATLLGITLIMALSACGSGSNSPGSIDDINDAIEGAGYECDEPTTGNSGSEDVSCGDDIYGTWFQNASDEVKSFDALKSVYEKVPDDLPVDVYVIRGDQWRIAGDESAVTKVADSLNESVVSISN